MLRTTPPGIPNIYFTPSLSRHSMRIFAPVSFIATPF